MTPSTVPKASSSVITPEPQLFVSDIDVACRFYVHKLGFKPAFAHGATPFYAQVFRDGARLNLRKVAGPVFDRDFRARERDPLFRDAHP
jgi:catechol 2,3-dioxygenase-like lactoylglutathione lyase family enzyme